MIIISSLLKQVLFEKMSGAVSSCYIFKSVFTQNSGVELTPSKFVAMNIMQNFVGDDIFDKIMCRYSFYPKDLLTLLENTQDLKLTIIAGRWDKEVYNTLSSEEPKIYTYNVIIANPGDIIKSLPPAVFKETPETQYERDSLQKPIDIDMQLMTADSLELKRQGINTCLADTTIEAVLLYLAEIWDIKKVEITKVHNTKQYDTILLPPLIDLPNAVRKLQEEYGIYDKGVGVHYTNDTLYIFPAYDTSPEKLEVCNIFKLPEGSVDGGDSYHRFDGTDLYIATFANTAAVNTAQASAENVGNAVVVKQADTSMTAGHTVANDGKITMNQQSTIMAKVNSSATATSNMVAPTYGGTSSNIFDKLSNLSAGQLEHVGVGWLFAEPFAIEPGMKCILHYDDTTAVEEDQKYTTTPGVVEAVEYTLSEHSHTPTTVYKWKASVSVAVAPKEQDVAQTTDATPTK